MRKRLIIGTYLTVIHDSGYADEFLMLFDFVSVINQFNGILKPKPSTNTSPTK